MDLKSAGFSHPHSEHALQKQLSAFMRTERATLKNPRSEGLWKDGLTFPEEMMGFTCSKRQMWSSQDQTRVQQAVCGLWQLDNAPAPRLSSPNH